MENKPSYLSKTVIVNLIMALSAFVPSVNAYLVANPEIVMSVLAGVNILLRFFTKEKISLL